jgi:hypothetical protein
MNPDKIHSVVCKLPFDWQMALKVTPGSVRGIVKANDPISSTKMITIDIKSHRFRPHNKYTRIITTSVTNIEANLGAND